MMIFFNKKIYTLSITKYTDFKSSKCVSTNFKSLQLNEDYKGYP
nr:MAG TPA: hypothetical protein [Bacteriophage sp.]